MSQTPAFHSKWARRPYRCTPTPESPLPSSSYLARAGSVCLNGAAASPGFHILAPRLPHKTAGAAHFKRFLWAAWALHPFGVLFFPRLPAPQLALLKRLWVEVSLRRLAPEGEKARQRGPCAGLKQRPWGGGGLLSGDSGSGRGCLARGLLLHTCRLPYRRETRAKFRLGCSLPGGGLYEGRRTRLGRGAWGRRRKGLSSFEAAGLPLSRSLPGGPSEATVWPRRGPSHGGGGLRQLFVAALLMSSPTRRRP